MQSDFFTSYIDEEETERKSFVMFENTADMVAFKLRFEGNFKE